MKIGPIIGILFVIVVLIAIAIGGKGSGTKLLQWLMEKPKVEKTDTNH